MPFIHLTTFIAAPPERVFDLARSVDLHKFSMQDKGEKIVNGVMSGLMNLNDTVTWKARHFFRERTLTVRLTAFSRPHFFTDEQAQGDFKMMKHEHYFKPAENGTLMIDQFHFELPYGLAGKMLNRFYLVKYLTQLLATRNEFIRKAAEGSQWKQYIT